MRMRFATLISSSFAVAIATASAALDRLPVVISDDEGWDTCSAVGEVVGLDAKGDNFLAVRSGPNPAYGEIDRLLNGDQIFLCDERGEWIGIVYPPTRTGAEVDEGRHMPDRAAPDGRTRRGSFSSPAEQRPAHCGSIQGSPI